MKYTYSRYLAVAAITTSFAGVVLGGTDDFDDLTSLSLEELLNIEITVASRTVQSLSEVPGAVYVLTGDEIRRAGHASVQEALRMVPGMYVSNWTGSQWDVTSRGFGTGLSATNFGFLNQLMVMIDGVPVNSAVFAGTDWALLDVDMTDIDRIEIIRGPGGILWGSNAVHGVVHIITKDTSETHGIASTLRVQNDEKHYSLRNGGSMGDQGSYRVYVKRSEYDTPHNPWKGFDQSWKIDSVAARFDWTGSSEYEYHAWGRVYSATLNNDGFDLGISDYVQEVDNDNGFQAYAGATSPNGKHAYSAWMSYDRQDLRTEVDTRVLKMDLEYRRNFQFSDVSNLSAGLGYQLVKSELAGDDPFFVDFDPKDQTLSTYRGFAVQTWNLWEGDLDVVVGGQVELNDTTGFEFQPTGRMSWHPVSDLTLWGAVTRSVRTPSLEELSLSADSFLVGDPNLEAEKVLTYELGVRKQLAESTGLDLALFYNDYSGLHNEEFDSGTFQTYITNNAKGHSSGIELAVDSKPREDWSLRGAYTLYVGKFTSEVDGSDLGVEEYHPSQQVNLRSYFDLTDDWQLSLGAYFSGGFGDLLGISDRTRLDLRLGYQPREGFEIFAGGQQLLDPYQSEFDEFDNPRRDLYFGLTWAPSSGD